MNYLSLHPIFHKKSVIMDMLDRVMLLSDPKFHYNNIEFIICTLLNNDYPAKFVFDTINNRLKYWCTKKFLVIMSQMMIRLVIVYLGFFYHILILRQRNFRRFVKTPT